MIKVIVLFYVLFPTILLGQKVRSTQQGGDENIFSDAIKQCLRYRLKEYKRIPDTIYIHKRLYITDSVNKRIDSVVVIAVDEVKIREILDSKTSIIVHGISPLQFYDGRFVISIIPFSTRLIDGRIRFGNGGGYEIVYSFKKRRRTFKFRSIKFYGI